jgi:hypothetical protein
MGQDSSNTLRTLGIVLTSILLFTASGILLLASACFGIISVSGAATNGQIAGVAIGCLLGAALLIFTGVTVIAKLSRGMVHHVSPSPVLPSVPASIPVEVESPFIDSAHFSHASRSAIQHLLIAISALIIVDLLFALAPGVVGNQFPFNPRFPIVLYTLIYRVLALAPYVVLFFALRRSPSPRSFAYALAVPAIPAIWGLFSLPLTLLSSLRIPAPLLSRYLLVVPSLLMDFLVLYYAWIAISRTGIHPPPKRLVIASIVMFVYHFAFAAIAGAIIAMTTTILHG